MIKCYDVQQLSMKFWRHVDNEVVQFQVRSALRRWLQWCWRGACTSALARARAFMRACMAVPPTAGAGR